MSYIKVFILPFLFLFSQLIFSQQYSSSIMDKADRTNSHADELIQPGIFYQKYNNHNTNYIVNDSLSFYQRKSEWRQIIDEYWGSGESLQEKRHIFNIFADYIQDKYPCFKGLNIDWDSLRTHYYTQINDSTSKGHFSAIMSNLAYSLKDFHAWAWAISVIESPLNPGTPIYIMDTYDDVDHFGASLTPLPDSTLLVVQVAANHPLELEPGDIILGYEGIPWKQLTFELFSSAIPKYGWNAGAESAVTDVLLSNAGMNWHLFKTIDIVRYSTNDTVHLPTENLLTLNPEPSIYNNPQLPVDGIPWPDFDRDHSYGGVTYGKIEGTNIGYIYVTKHWYYEVNEEFGAAVHNLMDCDGLIIDIRINRGGLPQNLYQGYSQLFNVDLHTIKGMARCSIFDLYSLCPINDQTNIFDLDNDPMTIFDRPIAVLTGPSSVSFGDIDAYTLKFHPMTRFFGKSTNGSLSGIFEDQGFTDWYLMAPKHALVNYYSDELLMRKEFPVDENVWLEPGDVSKGEDTVVKRALAWITSLAYAHNTSVFPTYARPGIDSTVISVDIENSNRPDLKVQAYIKNIDDHTIDSLIMQPTADSTIWQTADLYCGKSTF